MSDKRENPMIIGCYAIIAVTYLVLMCAYCGLIWAHVTHTSSTSEVNSEVESPSSANVNH